MSYCRFSSDDWKSMVYVYESCGGGFVCHVATRKHVSDTECPSLDWTTPESLMETYEAQRTWLDKATLQPIQLPPVEDFSTDTAIEMAEQLIAMKALGYYVPQNAIDALLEESESESTDHQD